MNCPICDAIPGFLVCTLHGGHMTATEVEMRHIYGVEGDKWVPRKASPPPSDVFMKMIDKAFDILRSRGFVGEPPK